MLRPVARRYKQVLEAVAQFNPKAMSSVEIEGEFEWGCTTGNCARQRISQRDFEPNRLIGSMGALGFGAADAENCPIQNERTYLHSLD